MIYPLIRINRAIAGIMIYPEHPIQSIAVSECVSVFGPFLNPNMYTKILGLTLSLLYFPKFSKEIIDNHNRKNLREYQGEICLLLLFILTFSLEYIK